MNVSIKGFVIVALLVSAAGTIPAFGSYATVQNPIGGNSSGTTSGTTSTSAPITVGTDKSSYNMGDKIVIAGTVTDTLANTPITIIIKSPNGNLIKVAQVDVGTDKTYSLQIVSGGPLWAASGTYEVDVQYGSKDRSNKTTFDFTIKAVQPTCTSSQILVNGTCFPLCTGPNTPQGCVVPEFGPVAILVLAIAIISIITISAKTRLGFIFRN